jgi:hypothetical protein
MTINTVVTWKRNQLPSTEVQHLIDDEILRLKAEGITVNDPVKGNGVTTRIWDTKKAAQDWIDFLNLLENAPESAVIVEEYK